MSVKKIKTLLESLPEPSVLFDELSKIKLEVINKYWLSNGLQLPKNNDEDRQIADIYRLLLITFSPEGSLPSMYRNAPRLRTSAELRESPKSGCQYDIKGELNLTSEFSGVPNSYYKVIFESNKINKVTIYPGAFAAHFSTGKLSSLVGVKNIEVIRYGKPLSEIPQNIGDLSELESLIIKRGDIESIPDSLFSISSLKHLDLSGNKIKNLSEDISKLENLEYLDISQNQLESIPDVLSKVSSLKDIIVYDNPLKDINDDLIFKTYPINHVYNEKVESHVPVIYAENILVLNSSWLEIPFSRICEITINKNVDTLRVESSEMLTKLLNSGSLHTLSHIKSLDLCWIPWEELGAESSQAEGMWVKTRNSYSEEAKVKEIPDGIKDFQSLEELDLRGNRLESFNNGILQLKNLKKLTISSNSISQLPDLSSLRNLEYLDCSSNRLLEIPESIFSLLKLKILDCGFNQNIKIISDKIHQLQHLESLNVNANDIGCLPTELGELKNLVSLNVSGNPLKNHLEIITKLPKLKSLDISNNRNLNDTISIPNSIADLTSLTYLDMSGCNLIDIPASIGELTNLEFLNIENSEVESIDPAMGNLSKMITLNLANNRNLQSVPETIGNLEKLENLKLYGCKNISEISDAFAELKNLKQLSLNYIQISNIDFVYEMTQLVSLELYDTKVNELSAKIKQLSELETLDIRSTSISSLPNEIGALHKLKEIQFSTLKKPYPDSLCNLTALETLEGSFQGVKKPYPKEFGNLTNLKRLVVTHDTAPNIPSSFSKLEQLVSLIFRDSEMETIPEAFNSFTNINQLDIRDNCIDEIEPEFLARLTQRNARNLDLEGNMVSYSASKIKKYKSLLPYAYVSS
jgi:Leucine-rich repeat (LRR) protein